MWQQNVSRSSPTRPRTCRRGRRRDSACASCRCGCRSVTANSSTGWTSPPADDGRGAARAGPGDDVAARRLLSSRRRSANAWTPAPRTSCRSIWPRRCRAPGSRRRWPRRTSATAWCAWSTRARPRRRSGFAVRRRGRARRWTARSAAQVQGAATEVVDRTRTLFYVDTIEYLRRGGRIGTAAALLATSLSVKPMLQMVEGRIVALEKVRTSAKAIARLVQLTVAVGRRRTGWMSRCIIWRAAIGRRRWPQQLRAALPRRRRAVRRRDRAGDRRAPRPGRDRHGRRPPLTAAGSGPARAGVHTGAR